MLLFDCEQRLQEFLRRQEADEASDESGDDDADEASDDMMHVGDGFYLYKDLYNNIYAHQREGVLWMWSLFQKRKGGILGDDMG